MELPNEPKSAGSCLSQAKKLRSYERIRTVGVLLLVPRTQVLPYQILPSHIVPTPMHYVLDRSRCISLGPTLHVIRVEGRCFGPTNHRTPVMQIKYTYSYDVIHQKSNERLESSESTHCLYYALMLFNTAARQEIQGQAPSSAAPLVQLPALRPIAPPRARDGRFQHQILRTRVCISPPGSL